uniref:Uncharacterized protein n=1 Tax=Anguilla anguilla TaxID=7936 RepID=A0A0E9QPV8_ANGAN
MCNFLKFIFCRDCVNSFFFIHSRSKI